MKDLTQGNVFKTIFYFSLPILAGNIFQQLYNITDSIIVGNFLGKESLAAVGFSYQINFLLIALSMGISLGASVLISRYYGAKELQLVKKVVDTGFLFSIILSIIISISGVCLSYKILVFFQVPENLLAIANTYLKIIFIGVIPTFAYNSLTNILRGVGDSKTPTNILIISTFINIVLVILFVKVVRLGVAGAAIATVISQFFSFIVCMLYMVRRYPELSIHFFSLQFDCHELKKSVVIGMPAMLQTVFISVGFMTIQYLINGFGTDCMAAFAAASKVDSFAEMPALNLGQAMTNFTAQNFGARKKDRIIRGGKSALTMGISISGLLSIIIFLFPSFFISLFNRDPGVVQIGIGYLRTVSVFYLVFAAMQILNGLLLGYGKSFVPMLASIGSLCLLQVPVAILLSRTDLIYNGIWIAAPVGWIGGLLIRSLYFRYIAKNC
ncbi:MATE family efflux transporter [Anaerocolumna sedimenticola]|uniref:Probable multidrug resistance protein NorM n=1 Tax=Anaerocolumna sedimenticola TaxID=2696063 RepID=A0A6P1TQ45_9FIRM|nr:MATE family efflux transporter [Anaerocolumna sedimenticola]QHQ63370.1 MATE family efflux transporter [Anaerocolumna sedimenticola]